MNCGQAESTDSLLTLDHTETNTEDAKYDEKRDFPCDNWGEGGGGANSFKLPYTLWSESKTSRREHPQVFVLGTQKWSNI